MLDRYTGLYEDGQAYLAMHKVSLQYNELIGEPITRFAQYESFGLEPAEIGLILNKKERGELAEVVRCKECRFRNTLLCRTAYKTKFNLKTEKWSYKTMMEEDGFCHIGERSVENAND